MARYTDIDKLIAEYDRVHVGHAGGARKLMVEAPIADVAPRAEVGEPLEDLLVEFDEFGMQPTILVPDPEGTAIEWKLKLEYAIGRIKADTAREICCKIEEEIVAALESNYRAMREHNLKRCPDSDGLFLERIYGKIDALRGIEGFVEELKRSAE